MQRSNDEPTTRVPQVHLLVGPVGAGKSTLALRLAREHAAVPIHLDDWMAELFRPDRPEAGLVEWYRERARRCVDRIWKTSDRILRAGVSVVLEIGLLERAARAAFYRRVDESGHALTVYVVDAARDVRRERVARRNRDQGETFAMVVPPAIFELASDVWEPVDDAERRGRDVRSVITG